MKGVVSMKRSKLISVYMDEINHIAEEHGEALMALYSDAFREGMKTGRRNTLLFVGLGIVAASIGSCITWFTYQEHKEKQT
jgi:hypothetical protein|nr:MAG TPA: hypothetical protein [Caudoviricetes sp.]